MPGTAAPIGGRDALNKRIPKNSKYDKVKSVVNSLNYPFFSGYSVNRVDERFDARMANIRFRRDEKFRRIKVDELEEIVRTEALDILLLDIRDEDEFEAMHIRGARNYPVRLLNRSMHPFTPGILDYSNREPERIIVIYDLDEHRAVNAGNLFFEKGVDNVFVLSGGLKKLQKEVPWFLDGTASSAEPFLTSKAASEKSVRTSASSAFTYQSQAPGRRTALDGPVTFNKGSGQPWK